MNKLGRVQLLRVFSEQNKVAVELAKGGARRTYGDTIIFVVPPVFVAKQLEADTIGISYVHKINSNFFISPGQDVPTLTMPWHTLVAKTTV